MIIIKYLVRETFKCQVAILFILLLIFFCQKLLKIFSAAIDGEIPKNLVFSLLALAVSEMVELILPLSLFIALLMTFGKFYIESEIIVMHACGISRTILLKSAMLLALITGIVAGINTMWVGPLSSRYQNEILAEAKANPSIMSLTKGLFYQATDRNLVLFIDSINGSRFKDIFLAQFRPKGNSRPSIVVADSGQLAYYKDGTKIITLNKGTRFEGTAMLRDFRITDFQNYQAIIPYNTAYLIPNDIEQMDFFSLLNTNTNRAKSELHWRITLVFTVFMMVLIVVPLSIVRPRQNIGLSILPPILLYLLFFLLQSLVKSNGGKGKIDPILWTWIINAFYLLLAISLNLWDTIQIRRFRARFMRIGAI